MGKMKIVLLALYDVYSFGIRGLHALLESEGYDVTSVFFKNGTYVDGHYTQDEFETLVGVLNTLNPGLLCIGVRSPLFPLFARICNEINPDISVLAGGHHATADPKSCELYAEYVCVGEGEDTILRLVKNIEVGYLQPNETPGIYPNIENTQVKDLDSLPLESYSNSNIYLYSDPQFETQTEMWVWTTRRCHFHCAYCHESIHRRLYGKGNVRRRSVGKVIQHVNMLQHNFPNLEEIIFTDPVFTFDIDWIRQFSKIFPEETGLKFRCFGHPKLATFEMLAMLKEAGMTQISFGIESGSKRIMKIFNRVPADEEIIKLSRYMSKMGIMGRFDIIVNNPFDSPESMRETRELVKKLTPPFIIRHFSLRFFPGNDITNKALELGLIDQNDVEGSKWCKFGGWQFNSEYQ